ncbi:type II toxin-antitoxin system prevent-host-death family antitoxin [Rhizobium sp. NRK18]|uniref:type II toxin-antitoxin system prevent-host-death family antitoxin n=1 Tax=Rhizobium sp. NRK18 TaxID=2964667 RepID=UPI0021C46AC7|nr:type II toxin-antitoxin system prevent-host-death family antitoxin [Rhizobium sp. NRK18]MCQ2003531.1 type II toxin-antitoxin system prevent-host-death family antitoxin [Rhizobium sp. NRK18]
MTSREFNQNTSGAKKAAEKEPVFITDRGRPAHVLLSIEEYERLAGLRKQNLAELLSMPEDDDIDFDPPKLGDLGIRPAEFD